MLVVQRQNNESMRSKCNDLQAYIDEYTYRFNRHFIKAPIFDNLILGMLNERHYLYVKVVH